jgi:ubiquitin-conjugating enzyme E2 J2
LTDCDYEGGVYFGKLEFPQEYPMKPPNLRIMTPSGRFNVNANICLSFTNFHRESWNPTWKIESIIIGLISFMTSEDPA